MATKTGFQVSRKAVVRVEDPKVARPEQGDADRLERLSNSLKNLGDNRSAYVAEIGKLWGEAQDRFLTIGRYLLTAKERLPHGAFEAMIADELPFGRGVAFQLRAIATAVEKGKITEDEMPRSYTIAYRVVTLDDVSLARAKRERIVRADVRREEVLTFIRRVTEERQERRPAREVLSERRDALKRRIQNLVEETREAKRELAEVEAELGGKIIQGRVLQEA